jgi:GAF domain-containing protein
MNAQPVDPLARLATTAEAVETLRDLFASEEPLDVIASRVAESAAAATLHADAVSITVLTWPEARTAASTDARALDLDDQQYASGRGPCLEAALSRTPIRGVMSEDQERWPEFVTAAIRHGIRASLSVPLIVGGVDEDQELVGSLNIYSDTAAAFDPFDEVLMRLFTVAASQAITNANRWAHSRVTVTQLEAALISRSNIDMAKGALMALYGCDPDEAFARLAKESQNRNVKVRELAVDMLAQLKNSVKS